MSELEIESLNFWTILVWFVSFLLDLKYSPTRSSYLEANLLEEKISKIVLFVMIRMTPTLTVGMRFIYSFLLYFLTDLRNDALELTSPMW